MVDSKQDLIKKLTDSIDTLPTLPNMTLKVISVAEREDTSADDILNIIKFDQGITANCLKLCNSAYFGRKQRVTSLKEAVVILGFKNIIKVVFASTVSEVFTSNFLGYGLRQGELWRHSVATAIASQMLYKYNSNTNEMTLFTAALLHDMGKLVLDTFIAKYAREILEMLEQGYSEVDAETKLFGVNHADIGSYLANDWQFPDELCEAIQDHHSAMYDGNDSLYALVRLSNIVAKLSVRKQDGIIMSVDPDIIDSLNITQEQITEVITNFPTEMKKAIEFLNLG